MLSHLRPSLFYGTTLAALVGLALGLTFHGPWENHAGGPEIRFASAAAAELARPLNDSDIVQAAAYDPAADQTPAYADIVYADNIQLPPDSLPVVRLNHMNGTALPAAQDVQRVAADDLAPTEVVAVEEVKDDIPSDQPPRTPASNTYVWNTSPQPGGF